MGVIQIVGQRCAVCTQCIALAAEGGICIHCNTPWHLSCSSVGELPDTRICPICSRVNESASSRRVQAAACPRCQLPCLDPPVDRCEGCGMTCSWDDRAHFEQEMVIRRRWGRTRLSVGLVYALCAVVPLPLAFWLSYVSWVLMGPLGLLSGLLSCAVLLGASGWLCLQSGRALSEFRRTRHVPVLTQLHS